MIKRHKKTYSNKNKILKLEIRTQPDFFSWFQFLFFN